jgi:clan AA aspartic protease (TIGR02281 family)
MRMDTSSGQTAAEWLATAGPDELARVIRDYGEERFAAQIAKAIVARREAGRPLASTGDLAALVTKIEAANVPAIFAELGTPTSTVETIADDTGASVVSFSAEDAAKIGLREETGQRRAQFHTANGVVTASMVRVPEMRLQGIVVHDVEAAIMPRGAMQGTLLGMSFMRKLQSYESRGTSMVLKK